MRLIVYAFLYFIFFSTLSCNSAKQQYEKQKQERNEFERSNTRFFIYIKNFHLVPCREYSYKEHISITDKYINYIYGDHLVVLDSTNQEVKLILDSIELQITSILNNIKPAYYDCKESDPKEKEGLGEPTRYVNFGKSFTLALYSQEKRVERDKRYLGIDSKVGKYHLFDCHSVAFINLIALLNKLITISIEKEKNPKTDPFFLINKPVENNCECKEFEIGRIFKD
jgi:hypothetical protein